MSSWQRVEPPSDDAEPHEYIEPWQPRVGQRVRVRLSGECHVAPHPDSAAAYLGAQALHADCMHGATGIIDQPFRSDEDDIIRYYQQHGHPWHVVFDGPVWDTDNRGEWGGSSFAAAELEPIDAV